MFDISGAPIIQYCENKQKYIFTGMAIIAGLRRLRGIPSFIIEDIIVQHEMIMSIKKINEFN